MPKIPLTQILIEDRQRLDLGDVDSLARSLTRYGQIQPIVLRQSDNRLVAGGRRCAAASKLGWPDIDFVYREDLSDSTLGELELEENIRRKQISWQEQCLAIRQIHTKKSKESALESKSWGHRETAEMLGIGGHSNVYTAIKVAQRLEQDPTRTGTIWKCESVSDAIRTIIKEQEDEALKLLNEKEKTIAQATITTSSKDDTSLDDYMSLFDEGTDTVSTENVLSEDEAKQKFKERYLQNALNDPEKFEEYWLYRQDLEKKRAQDVLRVPLSGMLFNQDAISFMLEYEDSFDHIITDIPYGIDMSMLDQENQGMMDIDGVAKEHDVDDNLDLIKDFFKAAYFAVKDKGFVITWCDQMLWQRMYDLAIDAGFKVQRWPVTWVKTHSCMNQAAQYNFTKSTEIAMICRKGNATLNTTASTCVIQASNEQAKKLYGGHPFVKPYEVWEFLVEKCTRPGDLIYEPFAGRGSGVVSMLKMGRRVIATELQETHYNHLVENVKQHYKRAIGEEVIFV